MSDEQSKSGQEKLIAEIRNGNKGAFEKMFHMYYAKLCVFANSYVKSFDVSRDVVQEVFIKIWDNRYEFDIRHSLSAYLYQAVRNQSLNTINKRKQMRKLEERVKKNMDSEVYTFEVQQTKDEKLSKQIWLLVEELPERRRSIFVLYRRHGLSYAEIAEIMGIKRKTVENQMGKALHYLRDNLDSDSCS